MNTRSSIAGALIATLGLIFYAYSNPTIASTNGSASAVQQSQSQSSEAFAYSQLTLESEDQFTFDEGGLQPPRTRTLTALMRFLESNERPTYINLLNAIGSRGWELVETQNNTVTFKRRVE